MYIIQKISTKISSMPPGLKSSIALFTASLVTSGISYIVTPIYTRMLSPSEYGLTSMFMTWHHLFGIVAMFCLSAGVFNNGMIDFPKHRDDYSYSMLMLSNLITAAFSVVIIALYPLIGSVLKVDFPLLLLMCASFFFMPAYNFWTARQRYEYKYKYMFLWSLLCAFLSPLTAVLCILMFPHHRLYARLFGAQCSLMVIHIIFYVYLGMKNKFKLNTKYWRFALKFNLPLIPHYLSTYLLGSSDKIMITNLISEAANGYYSVAHSVASVATIMWSAVNASLVPYTYENCKKKNYNAIAKVTNVILTAFAVGCLLIIMMAPEVVAIMATKEYMEAIYVIPPIIGGVFFQVQYFLYANVVYYYKKPKYVMIASLTATVLNLVLNYIFISRFGYLAAGYTTIFCYVVQAAIDFIAMRSVAKHNVYDMKYIGILSSAVIIVSLLSNLIYDYRIVRYAIVLICLIVAFIYRKKFINNFMIVKNKEKTEENSL